MVSEHDRAVVAREVEKLKERWGKGWFKLGRGMQGDLIKAAVYDVLDARLDDEEPVEARDLIRAANDLLSERER